MSKKTVPLWAQTGHSRPISRRDFLASGLLPFSASLLTPGWLQFLAPSRAVAATCAAGGSTMIPFVTLNLAGGAAMQGNYVPQDAGLQPLANYDVMGLGDGQVPLEREFGNAPFAGNNISQMLVGIRATGPTAIAKTAFVAACVRTQDDSSANKLAIDGLVSKAGLIGSQLPNLGVTNNTVTGIRQAPAVLAPDAPLIVNGFSAITGSLGYAGAAANLNSQQQSALAKMLSRLTGSQARKLASVQTHSHFSELLECAGIKNEQLIARGAAGIDPRLDANSTQLNAIWGINTATANGNRELVFASMIYNCLNGQAGPVSLELGGYDYHDNTRTRGDQADLLAGQTIGRILETASVMNRPLFLYVCSDGAVSSERSASRNSPWNSDRGSAGVSYIFYFDPAGRRATSSFQIGHFTQGQAADETFVSGGSAEVAAAAVFANYLQLNNRLDLFDSLAGRALDSSSLNKVLRFG